METLFVLLYWPLVGLLIQFATRALLQKGVGPWRNFLLICLPLWALSGVIFESAVRLLHLHGRLLQMVGYVASQRGNAFYNFLYTLFVANCFYVSTEPVFRAWRKKKAAKAALAAGE